jgi:hypothetical protein
VSPLVMRVIERFLVLEDPSGPFTRRDGPRRVRKESIKRHHERDSSQPIADRREGTPLVPWVGGPGPMGSWGSSVTHR